MRERFREVRDEVVHALARLSLIAVLAVMGALFVGSAAVGGTAGSSESTAVTDVQPTEREQEGVLDDASPMGLLLGMFVIGGGMAVLVVGAFKPDRRERERVLAADLRD